MIKTISLLKRKPGMTMDQFKSSYEELHVPAILKYVTNIRKYVRNYVKNETAKTEVLYDCVTEVCLDSMADLEGFLKARDINPDSSAFLQAEIKAIFDWDSIRLFCVDEVFSKISEGTHSPAGCAPAAGTSGMRAGMVKAVALIK